ncbi:MAG: hypothetical protein HKN23_05585 [Verrucomicrobiales bacterium]|nr:hypothetical protein [Verrucomicrobiales bacterium]
MKLILPLFPLVFLLTGCREQTPPKVAALEQWEGSEVTVYFRRDMLGAAGSPIAPTSTWLNNTKVSLDGKIMEARLDGVFLDSHYKVNSGDTDLRHSVFWIPNESILTVESKK